MAKNAQTEKKMQAVMDSVSQACANYDLTISRKKSEVVNQPEPAKPYSEPIISVNGQRLQVVEHSLLVFYCMHCLSHLQKPGSA